MAVESENKLLKSELSRKFLQNCLKKIDSLDADLTAIINQLEVDARERIIDSYYQKLGKDPS